MAILPNSFFVRVTHLEKNAGRLHLNDLEDETLDNQHRKIPIYIPFGETIDIPLTDAVLISYRQGSIFNFSERGLLDAYIFSDQRILEVQNSLEITAPDTDFVLVDTSGGDVTITLPELSLLPAGQQIVFKKTTGDTNSLIVQTQDSDRIDQTLTSITRSESFSGLSVCAEPDGSWWQISAFPSGGGGGGGGGPSGRSIMLLSRDIRVLGGGTLYLSVGDVVTSETPITLDRDVDLASGTITVNEIDSGKDFDVEVLVNGSVVETLPLPAGSLTSTSIFSSTISAGDSIEVRVVRTSGSGPSSFNNLIFVLRSVDT